LLFYLEKHLKKFVSLYYQVQTNILTIINSVFHASV